MKFLRNQVPFILLIFIFSGCASMMKKVFITPKITYEAMKVDKLELTGAHIRLYLAIDNKNNLDFDLASMEHEVFVDKNKVFESVIKDRVFIKANEKTIVEFPIDVSFLVLKENVQNIWKKQKIDYHVNSSLVLDTALGKFPVKIDFGDTINLPPFPDLEIENVKADKMGFTEMKLSFFVKVLNNDKVQLNVKELTYEISLNDFEIAKGTLESVKKSDKNNNLVLQIPVNLQFLELKSSITDMLKKGEISYNVRLHINIKSVYGDYILPLDKKGTTKIY